MRVKINESQQDVFFDLFEIKNVMSGIRTGAGYEDSHLIGRFSYNQWHTKPIIFKCKNSTFQAGSYDAYVINTPNIKAETMIYQPMNFSWAVFHRKGKGLGFQAVKNTLEKHYSIPCDILIRKDAVLGVEDKAYGLKTQNDKLFGWVIDNGIPNKIMAVHSDIFFHVDREMMKTILPDNEYHAYRVNVMGRQGIDNYVFGDIDTDVVGLDELIQDFDSAEFIQNFITEMSLLID